MSESLRDFHLFVAVYEERSFTAAAAREHATQSGVSQHVRKLEDSLGALAIELSREDLEEIGRIMTGAVPVAGPTPETT